MLRAAIVAATVCAGMLVMMPPAAAWTESTCSRLCLGNASARDSAHSCRLAALQGAYVRSACVCVDPPPPHTHTIVPWVTSAFSAFPGATGACGGCAIGVGGSAA
jgi:hypothetical protein